mmetsp:Transcript_3195/g.6696  ORF Transcript_3195/g.6696 Transcript_3195/m.6696 type:complete len:224 (-) Transcript_3195:343-1014(-)
MLAAATAMAGVVAVVGTMALQATPRTGSARTYWPRVPPTAPTLRSIRRWWCSEGCILCCCCPTPFFPTDPPRLTCRCGACSPREAAGPSPRCACARWTHSRSRPAVAQATTCTTRWSARRCPRVCSRHTRVPPSNARSSTSTPSWRRSAAGRRCSRQGRRRASSFFVSSTSYSTPADTRGSSTSTSNRQLHRRTTTTGALPALPRSSHLRGRTWPGPRSKTFR